jgi:hypothetical protein
MIDPRERYSDAEEVFRIFGDSLKAGMWGALPGIVESVNYAAMTVSVQPTIMGKITQPDGTVKDVAMPLLPDVPIVYISGGGTILTTPIAQGDECIVIFSSLCIDGWWQLGEVQPQTDIRSHDLSDGMAIIGPRSQAKLIPNISQTTAQMRDLAGDTYYELDPVHQTINVVAPGGFNVTGPSTFTGTVGIDGNVQTTGNILNNGKHVDSTHEHTSESPGTPTSPPL